MPLPERRLLAKPNYSYQKRQKELAKKKKKELKRQQKEAKATAQDESPSEQPADDAEID